MSEQSDNNNPLDLSALDFGPAWARDKKPGKKTFHKDHREENHRDKSPRQYSDRPKRKFTKRREDQFERPPRRERVDLPEGIKASIMPIEEGMDNLVKQIAATGRTYSVFDLARVILKSRDRYNVCFTTAENSDYQFFHFEADGATFLTAEEAVNHFAQTERFTELYKEVEVESEAPKGNFPSIACCGFTGDPIAPPNYHEYQAMLADRHAAGFANMSLEKYRSRVKTDRDPEKVAAWLESMKNKTKYQVGEGDDLAQFDSKADALRHFKTSGIEAEFSVCKKVFVNSNISFNLISPGLASGLLDIISDQNRYPGELSSFLCRQLSGRHLAVYKWQNKLHAGPSRPHAVPELSKLADRPRAMVKWVSENSGDGINELWKAVLPEEIKEEDKIAWFHDLHWMLNQGYLVLLENGNLYLSADAKKKPQRQAKKGTKKAAQKHSKPQLKEGEKKAEAEKIAPPVEIVEKADQVVESPEGNKAPEVKEAVDAPEATTPEATAPEAKVTQSAEVELSNESTPPADASEELEEVKE